VKRYQIGGLSCLFFWVGFVFVTMLPAGPAGAGWLAQSSAATVRPDATLDFLRPAGSLIARIVVEIAETAEAKMTGLMGRRTLGLDSGMLFLYDDAAVRYFWMKNTPVSLDMIFIDGRKQVVHIAESTKPMSEQFYSSRFPARYVVEVRAGFSRLFGIGTGTRIRWRAR